MIHVICEKKKEKDINPTSLKVKTPLADVSNGQQVCNVQVSDERGWQLVP